MTKRILQSKEKFMCEVFKKTNKRFVLKKNRLVWTLYYVSALYIVKTCLIAPSNYRLIIKDCRLSVLLKEISCLRFTILTYDPTQSNIDTPIFE